MWTSIENPGQLLSEPRRLMSLTFLITLGKTRVCNMGLCEGVARSIFARAVKPGNFEATPGAPDLSELSKGPCWGGRRAEAHCAESGFVNRPG